MPAREHGATPAQTSAETGVDPSVQIGRDHDAIARLADDLLPALIAKLAVSGLGEIEVRQGGWKARLRMPAAAAGGPKSSPKATDIHAGHTHGASRSATAMARAEERDRRLRPDDDEDTEEPGRIVAKSPAVGVYHPRRDLAVGMRVRSGDRIGAVDVLGVNQDVVSPVDGVIGSSLAEAGEAVEYGQELVRIELPGHVSAAAAGQPERGPAGVAGSV